MARGVRKWTPLVPPRLRILRPSQGLPYLAVVDDLRSRRRRMYLYPGADADADRTGFMTALGDRLLLMYVPFRARQPPAAPLLSSRRGRLSGALGSLTTRQETRRLSRFASRFQASTDFERYRGRATTLHAWHLSDDRLATAPPLPAPIARTVVEGETVLIVTNLGAVFLWTFGHDALRPVDVDGCVSNIRVFSLVPPLFSTIPSRGNPRYALFRAVLA